MANACNNLHYNNYDYDKNDSLFVRHCDWEEEEERKEKKM